MSVKLNIRKRHEKRGKWLSPRVVLIIDNEYDIETVPHSNGHKILVVVEETSFTVIDEDLASPIVESIDKLDTENLNLLKSSHENSIRNNRNEEDNSFSNREENFVTDNINDD